MISFVSTSSQEVTSVSNYTPTLAGSISFWFIFNTSAGTKGIISCPNGNFNQGTFRISQDTGSPTVTIKLNRSTTLNAAAAITAGTLYHGVATWSDAAGTTTNTIFINGAQSATSSGTTQSQNAGLVHLGSYDTTLNYWDGSLQDVRIYDRVLPLDEIQTIYACRGTDSIYYGMQWRMLLSEAPSGTAASGTGSIINMGSSQINFTPTNSPVYGDGDIVKRRI